MAIAGVLANSSALAQDGQQIEFAPASAWSLDYGDHACTLTRQFTSGDASVTLMIEQVAPGHLVNVVLASEDMEAGSGTLRVQVAPGSDARDVTQPSRGRAGELRAVRFTDSLLPDAVAFSRLGDAASLAQFRQLEASIEGLTVTNGFAQPVRIDLGNVSAPMTALRACVDDLWLSWGFDPQVAARVTVAAERVAQMRAASRIRDAYPREMVRRGQSARVTAVMVVGPDGRVAQCRAHNPEPYPEFETVTCERLLEYARYEPARDAAGNAVAGIDAMEVVFSLGS